MQIDEHCNLAGTNVDTSGEVQVTVSSNSSANTNVGRSYFLSAPKYFKEDCVQFLYRNKLYSGEIVYVETKYDYDFKAFHVYGIYVTGHKHHYCVGQQNIVCVI